MAGLESVDGNQRRMQAYYALESRGIVPTESEIAMVPRSTVPVTGADVETLLKLIEAREGHGLARTWAWMKEAQAS